MANPIRLISPVRRKIIADGTWKTPLATFHMPYSRRPLMRTDPEAREISDRPKDGPYLNVDDFGSICGMLACRYTPGDCRWNAENTRRSICASRSSLIHAARRDHRPQEAFPRDNSYLNVDNFGSLCGMAEIPCFSLERGKIPGVPYANPNGDESEARVTPASSRRPHRTPGGVSEG